MMLTALFLSGGGMPWNILMPIFLVGVSLGIGVGMIKHRKRKKLNG